MTPVLAKENACKIKITLKRNLICTSQLQMTATSAQKGGYTQFLPFQPKPKLSNTTNGFIHLPKLTFPHKNYFVRKATL